MLPLNEAQSRWYVAQKALDLGRGGIRQVHKATGVSQTTIIRGLKELEGGNDLPSWDRIRAEGGGRKRVEAVDPSIVTSIKRILDDTTAGDPMAALKWTVKSTKTLATELTKQGHKMGPRTVSRLLQDLEYSLHANQKNIEGSDHPDRDAQFRYINEQVAEHEATADPVISVDTKKKELVGNFKNAGREYRKKGDFKQTNAHDFRTDGLGLAVPYGLFDKKRNHGLVNVGVSHDTAEFAAESIRQWWLLVGRQHYPKATRILICADSGGSNASRSRVLKVRLQSIADETGLSINVCHYPPGTSKWNKIEHRMFSFISLNWRGKPLETFETVVNLIAGTTTSTGLKVEARLDTNEYKTGVKVTDGVLKQIKLSRHAVHPRWNYTISPTSPRSALVMDSTGERVA